MRQYIIGNWKMNGTKAEAQKLATTFVKRVTEASRPLPHIVLCPSYPYLTTVAEILKESSLEVGAQDCHPEHRGAFTGDVSAFQLKDVGCSYVIVGHSERRHLHHESNGLIRRKLEAAIKVELRPILCLGESAEEREQGKTFQAISNQLTSDLPLEFTPQDLIIAYEPLWAIGTGITPAPGEVEDIMGFIKHELSVRVTGGALVPILYGGSVTSLNAPTLLNLPHLDGLLVGGASLKLDEFWEIISASSR
ncbi:MAG: triose-phosphate isomerase [Proteobacteria bacterium]|nr:triose-phosphate isomerase [Pseudomonadota bacterium]